MFAQAKRDDPNIKARERTIRDLDAAHAKYGEIIRNLKEGLDFYNGLSVRLVELRDSAHAWSNSRRQELEYVENLSIHCTLILILLTALSFNPSTCYHWRAKSSSKRGHSQSPVEVSTTRRFPHNHHSLRRTPHLTPPRPLHHPPPHHHGTPSGTAPRHAG